MAYIDSVIISNRIAHSSTEYHNCLKPCCIYLKVQSNQVNIDLAQGLYFNIDSGLDFNTLDSW